ncbi:MAG: hypothetical protein ABJI96_21190 [Paracoccaceae bacterium]
MNATSALVLIMILAFSTDRLAKAILFGLSYAPQWKRHLRDPELISNKIEKYKMKRRYLIAYAVISGVIALLAVWWFPELRIIGIILRGDPSPFIDIAISTLVIMGGSDLVGRIVQISGIGDIGPQSGAGRQTEADRPMEIHGRLVLEKDPDKVNAEPLETSTA